MTEPGGRHLRLVHWKAEEARERARLLERAGYEVDASPIEPESLRALRARPPLAFLVDLSRLPSHGRDVALVLRQSKATRHVPILFLEGAPEKVEGIRKLLPDASYASWRRVRSALTAALARPPVSPVVPPSNLAGYSGTPLPKKLGIKPGGRVALVGAPEGFEAVLGPLPEGALLARNPRGERDLTLWFVRDRRALTGGLPRVAREGGQALWIIWPKRTSALASDLGEPQVRELGLAAGLVDYKVCAVDQTWSGLKFTTRKG